jgi:hypothetical protein
MREDGFTAEVAESAEEHAVLRLGEDARDSRLNSTLLP